MGKMLDALKRLDSERADSVDHARTISLDPSEPTSPASTSSTVNEHQPTAGEKEQRGAPIRQATAEQPPESSRSATLVMESLPAAARGTGNVGADPLSIASGNETPHDATSRDDLNRPENATLATYDHDVWNRASDVCERESLSRLEQSLELLERELGGSDEINLPAATPSDRPHVELVGASEALPAAGMTTLCAGPSGEPESRWLAAHQPPHDGDEPWFSSLVGGEITVRRSTKVETPVDADDAGQPSDPNTAAQPDRLPASRQPMTIRFPVPASPASLPVRARPLAGSTHELRPLPNFSAYAALRDRMTAMLDPADWRCVGFSGASERAGKSTLVESLSRLWASEDRGEVLAVDAAEESGLARRLGVSGHRGITDVLGGRVRWQQAIGRSPADGLYVLPRGGAVFPAETDSSDPLAELFAELRRAFRYVLVHLDGAQRPSGAGLVRFCDGVYLVVDLKSTLRAEAVQAANRIRHLGARLLGCVVDEPFAEEAF